MEETTFDGAFSEDQGTETNLESGEEVAAPPAEEVDQPDPDNQEQETSEDNQEETETSDEPTKATGLLAAKQAEKAKRKEAEGKLSDRDAKIEELQAKLTSLEQGNYQDPGKDQDQANDEDGDFWDDPDANLNQMRRQMQNERLGIFEQIARDKYDDFDDAMTQFEKLCGSNPTLATEMVKAKNPGEFVYQAGKNALAVADIGDPATYKDRIIKEYLKEQENGPSEEIDIPGSMVDSKSYGGNANAKPRMAEFSDAFPE